MSYIFSNILGTFIIDNNLKIIDRVVYQHASDEKRLLLKHGAVKPDNDALKSILGVFKDRAYSEKFHSINLELTKAGIRDSVTDEFLVIEAVHAIDDITKVSNTLMKRFRGWYALQNPEYEHSETDNEILLGNVLKANTVKKEKISMGAHFSKEDIEPVMELGEKIRVLYRLRSSQEKYLDGVMGRLCPNVSEVAGALIGARLLVHARSLRRLAMMPASTIQLLGAEQALFRHMRTGARAPRHGLIVAHPLLVSAPQKMHGKIARGLADKIAIAAKVDYFRGKFIGNKLREELEKKFAA
ncbi:hypothetical protein HY638_05755 [Candidatus Woesearchaeota archaeon]|nr:hypothetical protein [Candidatus Woesearchaeota archaeon]